MGFTLTTPFHALCHFQAGLLTLTGGYPKRTEANAIDSDGTVIFSHGKLAGGSALTRRLCRKHGRPFLHVDLAKEVEPARVVSDWIRERDIKVLNVAGSRESKHPGIHDQVVEIIKRVLVGTGRAGTGQGDNVIRETVVPFLLAG